MIPDNPLPACPLPINDYPRILLAHGGGGRLMHQLIGRMFRPSLAPDIDRGHDSAVLRVGSQRIAFTTDSFVVRPLFFPGGDIGRLSIFGTVNDLAMSGARPLWLSAGFILEEGLPMEDLWRIVQSMRQAAQEAGVELVTGDTKVVDRVKGDGTYINTSGIGLIDHRQDISPQGVQPGDVCIVSGDLGRHGIAILNAREELALEADLASDLACLAGAVQALLDDEIEVHCLRDLTRGGLASALIEIAEAGGVEIGIRERSLPIRDDVRGACEILGLDPAYVANEGRFVLFVPPRDEAKALQTLRRRPEAHGATAIGRVTGSGRGHVSIESSLGIERVMEMFSGEQLPRIC